jgi:hypothetical protein
MDRQARRLVKQLADGRFIIAAWVPRAGEWYAVELDDPTELTAGDIEELGRKRRVTKYKTREEAEAAVHRLQLVKEVA